MQKQSSPYRSPPDNSDLPPAGQFYQKLQPQGGRESGQMKPPQHHSPPQKPKVQYQPIQYAQPTSQQRQQVQPQPTTFNPTTGSGQLQSSPTSSNQFLPNQYQGVPDLYNPYSVSNDIQPQTHYPTQYIRIDEKPIIMRQQQYQDTQCDLSGQTYCCCRSRSNSQRTETKQVRYTTRAPSNQASQQQPQDIQVMGRLADIERLHLQEIREIEQRMDQQFQTFVSQRRAEDQMKEINDLRYSLSSLNDQYKYIYNARVRYNNQNNQPQQPIQMQPLLIQPQQQQPSQQPQMTQNNEDKLNQKISKLRHKKDLLRSQYTQMKSDLDQKNLKINDLNNRLGQSELNYKNLQDKSNRQQDELEEQRRLFLLQQQSIAQQPYQQPFVQQPTLQQPLVQQTPHLQAQQQPEVIIREVMTEDHGRINQLLRERDSLNEQLDQVYHNLQEVAHLRGLLLERDIYSAEYQTQIAHLLRDLRILDSENSNLRQNLDEQNIYIQQQNQQQKLLNNRSQSEIQQQTQVYVQPAPLQRVIQYNIFHINRIPIQSRVQNQPSYQTTAAPVVIQGPPPVYQSAPISQQYPHQQGTLPIPRTNFVQYDQL